MSTATAEQLALADPTSREVEPLGPGWITVTIVVGVMAALIALGGMVLSYRAVSTEMIPAFGAQWAWLVPIVVDLTVFVFSGVDLVLARLDMSHPLARWTVYGATGGTVWLNYSAGGNAAGRVAHVLMPAIWVVFVELMRHVVRRQVNLATGSHREPIPAARWLLSPWPTLMLWRRMVLWRVHSYTRALAQEKQRLAAVAIARDLHGRLWRFRISPLTRLQMSLGEIGPDQVDPTRVGSTDSTEPTTRPDSPGPTAAQPTDPADPTRLPEPTAPDFQDESDSPQAESDSDGTDPADRLSPLPSRVGQESELLAAARSAERWRGLPSPTRISQELGIGMQLAIALANALRFQEGLPRWPESAHDTTDRPDSENASDPTDRLETDTPTRPDSPNRPDPTRATETDPTDPTPPGPTERKRNRPVDILDRLDEAREAVGDAKPTEERIRKALRCSAANARTLRDFILDERSRAAERQAETPRDLIQE
jgi:hypothetical protein